MMLGCMGEGMTALPAFFSTVLTGTWKDCIWIEAFGQEAGPWFMDMTRFDTSE
jgi:hypothetical protein